MLQPKKSVGKKPAMKKTIKKSVNPADSYPAKKDKRGVPTIGGGEGTTPPITPAERKKMPKVGNMGSARNGKSFPDLNKDGKITKADILKGRGVIAKSGRTISKAQNGMSKKGNPKGYNPGTSPLPNTVTKGGYEKKMDTIGKGSTRSVRLIDSKGKVLGQERLGGLGAKKMGETYKKEKSDTESRRKTNLEFLESRKKTGEAATKSMKKAKSGASMKKCKYGCK